MCAYVVYICVMDKVLLAMFLTNVRVYVNKCQQWNLLKIRDQKRMAYQNNP